MLRLELVVLGGDGAQLLYVLPPLLPVRQAPPVGGQAVPLLAQEVLAVAGAIDDRIQQLGEGGTRTGAGLGGGHNPPSRFLADIPPELTVQHERAAEPTLWPSRHRYGAAPPVSGGLVEGPAAPAETFAAGDHVRHPKFGEGIVVYCLPSGSDYQLVVAYQGVAGIKKLLLSFAPLERVESE